jgi:hypothetical protein
MWVPPQVSRELEEQRRQYEAAVRLMLDWCEAPRDDLNRVAQSIDTNLAVLRALPNVPAGFPLKGGFFHVVRVNPGAPVTCEPITDNAGGFIEPTPTALERMLRERDLQNPQVRHALERREAERAEQARSAEASEREGRQEEMRDRILAATRTQVSMNPDAPWSQNASPAARRDAGARKTR